MIFKPVPFFVFLVVSFLISSNTFAAGSGAFRVEVPDAGAFGKGSAFVGEANTPSAVYYNPAGLTQIEKAQVSFGSTLIAPNVDVKRFNGDKVQMRRETFNVPHAYVAAPINNKLALGMGATSYFGLGTTWSDDSFTRYGQTKSAIENQDYMVSLAYKVSDSFSLAIGPDYDRSHANKQKKLYQGTGDGNFELDATSRSFGYRVAAHYALNEKHSFGLMYRSPIHHKYRGKADMDNLNNTSVIDITGDGTPDVSYQTVFGGTSYQTNFTEKFTLPQSVVLGYSFKPTTKLTFNADIEWMDWSSVKHEAVNWVDESGALKSAVLNTGNPVSRDWKSVISYAVGTEYAVNERLRLRTGYYHHSNPIPEQNWESSLPDSDSNAVTVGFGYDLTSNLTLDMAYSAMLFEKRKIENGVNALNLADNDGEYRQLINMLAATVTYKF